MMNGHQPVELNFDHLKPYEAAARIFCGMNSQNPEELMGGQHPLLAGVTLTRPAWHFAAEALINLSQMLAALRQAAEQAPRKASPVQ